MEQAIAAAAKAGMGVVGMKVMAGGFAACSPAIRSQEAAAGRRHAGGAEVGRQKPNVATTIPSMTDMDQLDENLKAMAQPFSAATRSCWPRIWRRSGRSIAACAASARAPAERVCRWPTFCAT